MDIRLCKGRNNKKHENKRWPHRNRKTEYYTEPEFSDREHPALYMKNKEREDLFMDKMKVTVTAVVSALMSWLGILAIPVFLLVGCNLIDYTTGLMAAPYRTENINSYKGIRGIIKKVCMWLLVLIGAWIDILINYAAGCAGVELTIPFIVATVVAVWLVVNEIISILENMIDIGVSMPPFLMPIVKYIKKQVEEKADIAESAEREDK